MSERERERKCERENTNKRHNLTHQRLLEALAMNTPQLDGLVIGGRHEKVAIVGKGDTAHGACVCLECSGLALGSEKANTNEMPCMRYITFHGGGGAYSFSSSSVSGSPTFRVRFFVKILLEFSCSP